MKLKIENILFSKWPILLVFEMSFCRCVPPSIDLSPPPLNVTL